MKKYILYLLFSLVYFFSVDTLAQVNDAADLNMMKEAYLNVQKENYAEALPYYQKMLDLYPKDPSYNYYAGRCILFAENDYQKAIQLLRYASVRNVPFDVYFYLGLAYLQTYQFEDAIANFRWFEKSGSNRELRELGVLNYISMAQNGLYLIKYFQEPEIYKKQTAYKDDFYASYELEGLEGRFFNRYLYLNHERDSLAEQSVIFVPNFMERNEVLYFSAKNKKRGDYDIFRITRLDNDSWSEPENLGDRINTPFDENYPFIHADGATLYFASKGHYSMGGYDLYRSSWDWETQQWSEPENLDFPINSPFDDILFVADPNKEFACFASDRNQLDNKYQIYKIKAENQKPFIEYLNTEQIKKVASLDVNVIQQEKKTTQKTADHKKKPTTSVIKREVNDGFIRKAEYDSLLNRAVQLQLKADSTRWVIDDKRAVFEKTTDGQERAQIGNEIIELEQKIYSLQKQSDICYEKVREIEQLNLASNKLSYKSETKDEVVEEIKTEENKKREKVQGSIVEEPKDNDLEKAELQAVLFENESIEDNSDFGLRVILPTKYNPKNPIKINEQLPNGIIYMIQLGAFSSAKNPSVFNGLEPLTCLKKENSNIHKYFAGKFYQIAEAEKKLPTVKSKGFKDAYIVAFNDGKIIPINTAVKLESKEKPVINVQKKDVENKTEKENLEIIYVIQGELALENKLMIDSIKNILSEDLDLFVKKNANDIRFIVNSFKTFDDAFKLKSKIEGIIQRDVEVHAYFAESQIPIDQARKITE